MDTEVMKAIVARARQDADPADSDEAIAAALGEAEDIRRDLRLNRKASKAATAAYNTQMDSLVADFRAIQDRCPHAPGEWNYGYETRAFRECTICGKDLP